MKRALKFIIPCIALILGYTAGTLVTMTKSGNLMISLIDSQQELSLMEQESRAISAYRTQPPIVAVWALEGLITGQEKLMESWSQDASPRLPEAGSHLYLMHGQMLAHGRLAKLYLTLNQKESAETNLKQAVAYGDKLRPALGKLDMDGLMDWVNKRDVAEFDKEPIHEDQL